MNPTVYVCAHAVYVLKVIICVHAPVEQLCAFFEKPILKMWTKYAGWWILVRREKRVILVKLHEHTFIGTEL